MNGSMKGIPESDTVFKMAYGAVSRFVLLFFFAWVGLLAPGVVFGAGEWPSRPGNYINDYADVLSPSEERELNAFLGAYERSTTNQIVVVIPQDLWGYDAGDLAQRIGESWGIGQRGRDNGVLVLIHPSAMPAVPVGGADATTKYGTYRDAFFGRHHALASQLGVVSSGERVSDTIFAELLSEILDDYRGPTSKTSRPSGYYGQAFIATGYGVEGYLTDLACARICREIMGPLVVAHRYREGIELTAIAIMEALEGVYVVGDGSGGGGAKDGGSVAWGLGVWFVILFVLPCLVVAFVVSLVRYWRARRRDAFVPRGGAFLYILGQTISLWFSYMGWVLFFLMQASASSSRSSSDGSSGGFSGFSGGGGGSFGGGGGGARF